MKHTESRARDMIKGLVGAVLSILVLMVGCPETSYGIYRSARISTLPDDACIRKVLQESPEIREYHEIDQMKSRDARQGPWWDLLYQTRYEGEGFWAILSVSVSPEKEIMLNQFRLSIHRIPSRKEVRKTRAVMRAVEQRLAAQCGIVELVTGVEEFCRGIKCTK